MSTSIDEKSNPAVPSLQSLIKLRFGARELTNFPNLMARQNATGAHRSRFRGRGMDFDQVRIYQPGDDVRTIDWRVTARTQVPHTKVYSEERERPILVLTDLRGPMFFGSQRLKSVVAGEIAASIMWAGLAANDRVGGLVFGQQLHVDIKAKRSHHAVLQYIHSLRDFCKELMVAKEETYCLNDMLEECKPFLLPGSTLFIVSDFHDFHEKCQKPLFEIARLARVNLCHVFDDLEVELPPPSVYAVSDGQHQTLLDSGKAFLRRRYADMYHHRCENLRRINEQLAGDLLNFNTSQSVLSILGRAYGKRRNVRRHNRKVK